MDRASFAIGFVSVYLFAFLIVLHAGYGRLVWLMFMASPLLVIWMVYSVIKFGKYSGKELGEDEEWGYEDKSREELGVF